MADVYIEPQARPDEPDLAHDRLVFSPPAAAIEEILNWG